MQRTDQALIVSHLKSDQNAFGILAARYVKLVYSVVFHYAKTVQDAEDLTQDVFVKILGSLKSFDGEKSFKPWILRIARNHALDWVKRKKPLFFDDFASEDDEASLLDSLPDPLPLPDAIAMQNEAAEELKDALVKLKPMDRLIMQLRYLKGLNFREIAEEAHMLLDTVKSRHRRALGELRKML